MGVELLIIKYTVLFTFVIIAKRHFMITLLVFKLNKRIEAINNILKLKKFYKKDEFIKYINDKNLMSELDSYISFLNKIEKSNKSYISNKLFNHADFYRKKREFIQLSSTINN